MQRGTPPAGVAVFAGVFVVDANVIAGFGANGAVPPSKQKGKAGTANVPFSPLFLFHPLEWVA